LRSLSSFSSLTRGQAYDNHCSLTEFSRGRLSPSIAHTACAIVKLQNPRPQRRQLCASREPCVGLQSSIFTLKSCVFHRFSVIITRPYFEILETLSHRNQAFGKTASPALGVESEGASWPAPATNQLIVALALLAHSHYAAPSFRWFSLQPFAAVEQVLDARNSARFGS
jgi:hypothetical protein